MRALAALVGATVSIVSDWALYQAPAGELNASVAGTIMGAETAMVAIGGAAVAIFAVVLDLIE